MKAYSIYSCQNYLYFSYIDYLTLFNSLECKQLKGFIILLLLLCAVLTNLSAEWDIFEFSYETT